jgi:hypothetical protein
MNTVEMRKLWLRWVVVNGLGEMLGLGMTFAVGASVIFGLGNQEPLKMVFISFVVAVGSGAIEATLVGLAQWWAMHPWFTGVTRWAWWLATLVGALIAYVLGYLPSTLMSIGEQTSTTQALMAEPEQWVILLLAGGLGVVGGAVLSFAQYLTMRKRMVGAGVWIPANMLAWLLGMPLIFWGIDNAQRLSGLMWQVLFMAGVLLLAGLVVGAIHGAFLVRLAERNAPA